MAGKVTARLLLGVISMGVSEMALALEADRLEQLPYPVTSGSHRKPKPLSDAPPKPIRFIVWGDHAAAVEEAASRIQSGGGTIVERARLQQVFEEQHIRLKYTPDDATDLLRVGHIVGADQLVFVETRVIPERQWHVAYEWTVYHVSVAVRAVDVQTGEIVWIGTATFTRPITNPETAIPSLTSWAMIRAVCPIELGYQWIEPGPRRKGGCKKEVGAPQEDSPN